MKDCNLLSNIINPWQKSIQSSGRSMGDIWSPVTKPVHDWVLSEFLGDHLISTKRKGHNGKNPGGG
jgi:hypothetical protein